MSCRVVSLLCIALGLASGVAWGQAPEPPAELANWGRVTAPNKKVKFKTIGETLEISLPSGANDFSIELGRVTAPRVLQPVSGDFTIQVQVSQVTAPGRVSMTPGRKPFTAAGLLVWQDEQNYIRLEHARCLSGGQVMNYANWEIRSQGQWVRQGRFDELPLNSEASWLRISRRGNLFSGAVSLDGKEWRSLPDIAAVWSADLQAGIVAVNDTRIPFKPRFSGLNLTTP